MQIIRYGFIALFLTVGAIGPATARVNIDLNLSLFPDLVPVPGYPVYYAPAIDSNYFFYDGRYWLFDGDEWYESAWYNGPWEYVERDYVPLFVLRIPVRYYRRPPPYFRGWYYDAPPRWGHRWGHDWERRHHGWNEWDHRRAPALAPLPNYQREYSRERYPDRDKQRYIHEHNYRYQPRETHVNIDRDRPERTRDTAPSPRRDDSQWQRSNELQRQIPRPQEHRDDNFGPPNRERNPRTVDDRPGRDQPPAQYQMRGDGSQRGNGPQRDGGPQRDSGLQKNEGRGHSKPRDVDRGPMHDNNGGGNDRPDRGEGRR